MKQLRRRLAKRFRSGVLIAVVAVVGSACSQGVTLPDDADEQLFQGQAVYQQRCAQCHGADGGGGIGFNIQEVETRLNDEEQRSVVVEGRNGRMPAFGATLSDSDIDAVVRYTREIL